MNKELAEAAGKALTDFLLENYVSRDPLSHIVESQSAIIKKQREEIEILKKNALADYIHIGDFILTNVDDGCVITNTSESYDCKHVSLGDVHKKLRELYFRTEEKLKKTIYGSVTNCLCKKCKLNDFCEYINRDHTECKSFLPIL